ncbi:hypothetical protein [Metabacillus fastidiosus]|uniref:hypothetical protein n=1 Tax=Metabacillus fastidiosus TaxID=1458 RepID=UPI000826C12B|nr:hypothetical protein [Metabacillus fastidiosus]MED4461807.1 hypothetical protein [Metabacillus fastidiosus]
MNQSNESNNFGGNVEESGNNQAGSNANQGTNDLGEAAGALNGAIADAMIGAQFGLIGSVIGSVSVGAIGNQIVEGAEVDDKTTSKNHDESNNNSINK